MRWLPIAVLILAGCKAGDSVPVASPMLPQDSSGAALFSKHCSSCHGDQGLGDGPAAVYLFPKPRDFSRGQFKIRTTESGMMPTDADLEGVLTRGMPGSAMPSFAYLQPKERMALVEHVKSLSTSEVGGVRKNRFEMIGTGKPILLPPAPAPDETLIARGKQVYREVGCAKCHGDYGRADGPSSHTLVDSTGMPIRANDFTRTIFKGGGEPSDIVMRFLSGMNGTPMPSFRGQMSERDMWAVAYYVRSLTGPVVHAHKSEMTIPAKFSRKELTIDPLDAAWNDMAPVDVPMMSLWQRSEVVRSVSVKALHNGRDVAICLEWDDATVNGSSLRTEDFSDAVAVMFPATDKRPNFVMGGKGEPCNIWLWKFDKQLDQAKFHDSKDRYPGMASDDCGYCGRQKPCRHDPTDNATTHDPIFLTGRGAGNPMSQERKSCVEDLLAAGLGTLTSQKPEEQNVTGKGVWIDGRWRVVMLRSLKSPDAKDAQFESGRTTWISVAIWDGAKGDRDGIKAVCYWQALQFE